MAKSKRYASQLRVMPASRIEGELTIPGDKSISHRSVMFGGLARGDTYVENFLPGEDCLCTLRIMQALGVSIRRENPTTLCIKGAGGKLKPSPEPLDCGNSGTTMRLLSGILAGQPFASRLIGDESLSRRPMRRIIDPLSRMGAEIRTDGADMRPPMTILGHEGLLGLTYESPIASAQLKSAILLAGLHADGLTSVVEPSQSRDHTERLLAHFHAPCHRDGLKITVAGNTKLQGEDLYVPGDFSSAAFWLVAASAKPGSVLRLRNVGLNPTRTGALGVLLRMSGGLADINEKKWSNSYLGQVTNSILGGGNSARKSQGGSLQVSSLFGDNRPLPLDRFIRETIHDDRAEPIGTLEVIGHKLEGTRIEGDEIPNVIDELPILAVAAALAEGETVIADAEELRVKETDRIHAMVTNLQAFGVPVEETRDGMIIQGGGRIRAARVQSHGDHRIAMACAVLGLFASNGPTLIENVDCIATSYPTFERDLHLLTTGSAKHFFTGGLAKNSPAAPTGTELHQRAQRKY